MTGATQGAMTGTSISPGWGTAAGAVIGGGVGFFRGKQRKKADSLLPEDSSPLQTGLLNELDRRINTARTGANVANEMAKADSLEGAGLRAISRGGAGAMGSYGLISRMAGERRNDVLAQGLQQESQLLGMKGQLVGEMEKRKKFLDLLRSSKVSAQGEQASQDMGMASNAMLTSLFSQGGQSGPELGMGGPTGSSFGPQNTGASGMNSGPAMGFGGMPLSSATPGINPAGGGSTPAVPGTELMGGMPGSFPGVGASMSPEMMKMMLPLVGAPAM